MKNLILIIAFVVVTGSSLFGSVLNDSNIEDTVFFSSNLYNNYLSNISFLNCKFHEVNLDSSKWKNLDFNLCEIRNTEYVRNINVNNVRFENGDIIDLSIDKSEINNLHFENSNILTLEFYNCNIQTLIIKNCKTTSLKLQNSTINEIKIIGGQIDKIEFIDDVADMIEVSYTLCNNLFFKSGSISRLKLVNLDFIESSKISFVETKIHLPRFSNFDISKIDITRANIDFKTFQLLNDYESDIGIYSKNQAKRNYLEARDTYYLINKQFQNADLDDSQIELEFLMNEAYVKSLNHNFSNFFYIVWNKYFRGHYGLSPSVVILTALKIWILFGIIYIFIGQFTNVGWALFIPINIYGKPIENMQPRFLNQNKWKLSMSYVSYCFLFSMQQLLIPGFSNSGLSFFKGIGLSQKLLIPIGIGKLISFLEYILGLILIFNFIQAFIRTL